MIFKRGSKSTRAEIWTNNNLKTYEPDLISSPATHSAAKRYARSPFLSITLSNWWGTKGVRSRSAAETHAARQCRSTDGGAGGWSGGGMRWRGNKGIGVWERKRISDGDIFSMRSTKRSTKKCYVTVWYEMLFFWVRGHVLLMVDMCKLMMD